MNEEVNDESNEVEVTNQPKTYVYTLVHNEEPVMQFMLTTTSDKSPELLYKFFCDLYNIIVFNPDDLSIEII